MSNIWLARLYIIIFTMLAMVGESLELIWGKYAWLSPSWVLVLVILWTVFYPHIFNVGSAWLVGLFMDVWTAELLGKHALLFLAIAFIISFSYNSFTKYSSSDRLWIVAIMIFVYQLILRLLGGDLGFFFSWEILQAGGTAIVSILLWLLISWFIEKNTKPIQL